MGALSSLPTVKPAGDTDALLDFPETNQEQFIARYGSQRPKWGYQMCFQVRERNQSAAKTAGKKCSQTQETSGRGWGDGGRR